VAPFAYHQHILSALAVVCAFTPIQTGGAVMVSQLYCRRDGTSDGSSCPPSTCNNIHHHNPDLYQAVSTRRLCLHIFCTFAVYRPTRCISFQWISACRGRICLHTIGTHHEVYYYLESQPSDCQATDQVSSPVEAYDPFMGSIPTFL